MKFTKEEISLCKQVAEKHRKEIEYGGWYLTKGEVRNNADSKWVANEFSQACIPLWIISDCLKFLREKSWNAVIELWSTGRDDKWLCRLNHEVSQWWSGKTPLEACLKAVLAVLEEE